MLQSHRIGVVIPALNEQDAIARVIGELPEWIDQVVVADNGSTDATVARAHAAGAVVVVEPQRGYGAACLAGLKRLDPVDIVVFIDGDYSDYPAEASKLVLPILEGRAEMAIGSRVLGECEPGALTGPQVFGNWLATKLIALLWKQRFTDLGPFRAIRSSTLQSLDMRDTNFGWTVEMQIKAARFGVPSLDVPVSYRNRIGISKVSGTVSGSIKAGTKILGLIAFSAITSMRADKPQRRTEQSEAAASLTTGRHEADRSMKS